MPAIRYAFQSLLHLFYPRICMGCGTDSVPAGSPLCLNCEAGLPKTDFVKLRDNPVEKTFWGRLELKAATSEFYFTSPSLIQELVHALKYEGRKDIGKWLGWQMGQSLSNSSRFGNIDCIVPLPLFSEKEKRRGYNQAAIIAEGISEIFDRPLITGAVIRNRKTDTQTHKNRIERWRNVESVFSVEEGDRIEGQHVLLVDDVITTGATIEACGEAICRVPGTTLSVATLAWTLPY